MFLSESHPLSHPELILREKLGQWFTPEQAHAYWQSHSLEELMAPLSAEDRERLGELSHWVRLARERRVATAEPAKDRETVLWCEPTPAPQQGWHHFFRLSAHEKKRLSLDPGSVTLVSHEATGAALGFLWQWEEGQPERPLRYRFI